MPVYKLNDETFEVETIIYVEKTGNDSNDGSSKKKAILSIDKALEVMQNKFSNSESVAMVFGKGEFTLTKPTNDLIRFYRKVYYFGNGVDTKIIIDSDDNSINYQREIKIIAFYNIFFMEGKSVNGLFSFNYGTTPNIHAYNCIFDRTRNSYYYMQGDYGTYARDLIIENCFFRNKTRNVNIYFSNVTGERIYRNNASSDNVEESHGGKNLNQVTYDKYYNITSDGWKGTGTGTNPDGSPAHMGIYGGRYALYKEYKNGKGILWTPNNMANIENNGILSLNNDILYKGDNSIINNDLLGSTIPVKINKKIYSISNIEDPVEDFKVKSIKINLSNLKGKLTDIKIE